MWINKSDARSSTSIPTNIAEGCGRNSQAEFIHFLQIVMGSSSKLENQLLLAYDLNYLDEQIFLGLTNELGEVRRMLNALLRKN